MPDNVDESPFAAMIAAEHEGLADLQDTPVAPEAELAQAVEQTTDSPQPEGVTDEVQTAMEGKTASEIGALIAQIPPEHRAVAEQLRRVMQSRVDKAKSELSSHPAMQLWGALENDAEGTMKQMLAHYGMNAAPGSDEADAPDTDHMEQRLAQIEAYAQQKQLEEKIDKAVKTVRDMARSAQIEITDLEMEEIVTGAANNNWNVAKEFKAAIADKLINRQAMPQTVNEKAQGEITDVEALWRSWATQKQ